MLSAVHSPHSSSPRHNKLKGGSDMSFQELFFLSAMLFPQLPTTDSHSKLQSDYTSFTGHPATNHTIIIWAAHQELLRHSSEGSLDGRNMQL
jgi:hypothetical protein